MEAEHPEKPFEKMIPSVKILLATYNGEKYITEQIQSILGQSNVSPQIAVNDDGSKDKTVNAIRQTFPEIPVRINVPGTGSAANNFLKMLCEIDFNEDFDYVGFADQDDIWLSDKLQAATSRLAKEDAALYCSNLTKWDMVDNSLTELKKNYPQKRFDYLFEGGSAGCTYVFTKQFALVLKNFVETVDSSHWKEFSHDWLVYFFARNNGHKVIIDGNSYIKYRIHDNNVHGHLNKLSWATIKDKFSKVFAGYHEGHVKNYIKYVKAGSVEEEIYRDFLAGYFSRNAMIWKYNFQLMRDPKKFLVFAFLNLLKYK